MAADRPSADGQVVEEWDPARRAGAARRILVCDLHRPFVSGPPDEDDRPAALLEALGRHLSSAGFRVEHARVPAALESREEMFESALLWRLLDLTATAGAAIDLVIASRFPAVLARHPNKVLWLLPEGQGTTPESGDEAGGWPQEVARRGWSEARRVFVTDEVYRNRLRREVGLDTALLPAPPADAPASAWKPVVDALTTTL